LSVHAGTRRGGNKDERGGDVNKLRPSASDGSVTSRNSERVALAGSTKTDLTDSPTVCYPPGLNLPYSKTLETCPAGPNLPYRKTLEPYPTVLTANNFLEDGGDPRLEPGSPGPPDDAVGVMHVAASADTARRARRNPTPRPQRRPGNLRR